MLAELGSSYKSGPFARAIEAPTISGCVNVRCRCLPFDSLASRAKQNSPSGSSGRRLITDFIIFHETS